MPVKTGIQQKLHGNKERQSAVVSKLCKEKGVFFNFVDDPMLIGYTPGPVAG
jgi:hypothetical protein